MNILAIALGGALGAVSRYGTGSLALHIGGHLFPWGTFIVNMAGAFLIGFLSTFLERFLIPPALRSLVIVGFIGSYTTFSTYMLESIQLIRAREYMSAIFNLFGSGLLGLLFVAAGLYTGRLCISWFTQGGPG